MSNNINRFQTCPKVISLDLRSALMEGEGVFAQEGFKGEGPGKEEEIDYCTVLNRFVCPRLTTGSIYLAGIIALFLSMKQESSF